ncbi:MAG: PIN domain-containing protein [Deltaproteobacteria bacterium]|nr:PIN domain-containing protein [Deltaproteobacteria bacterium]
MLAVDTNVLVAAHREDAPNHAVCLALVEKLAVGPSPFALFWPSIYEFLRVVTHHRVFDPPSSLGDALCAVGDLVTMPAASILAATERHAAVLQQVLRETPVEGNLIHDAHLVALAVEHGVHELITYDGDFKRFPQINSRTP